MHPTRHPLDLETVESIKHSYCSELCRYKKRNISHVMDRLDSVPGSVSYFEDYIERILLASIIMDDRTDIILMSERHKDRFDMSSCGTSNECKLKVDI